MATKRKANVAFERSISNGRVSAFAAARLAKQPKSSPVVKEHPPVAVEASLTAAVVGAVPYDDRHDEDGTVVGTAASQDVAGVTSFNLSSFDPDRVFQDDSTGFQVTLRPGETVTAVGEYDVEVLKGSITIYGATLRPRGLIPSSGRPVPGSGKHRVFALSVSALPQLVARRDGASIHVTAVRSVFDELGKLSPLFRNIASGTALRSFTILQTTRDDPLQRSLNVLESDKECSSLVATLSNRTEARGQHCTMVLGAKSAGKSTFNRMLCNNIVTMNPGSQYVYLDIDPGQPEFGPPGQISLVEVIRPLFGPPFSHLATAESHHFHLLRSHAIASTSFKDDPDHYMACVGDLIRYISHRKLDNIPLVVNSCGWVSGIGASVIVDVVSLLHSRSMDVVTLEPIDPALVGIIQTASSSIQTHRLPRRITRFSVRTPAELRSMQSLAYFHHGGDSNHSTTSTWRGEPVDSWWPYCVAYDGASPDILAILSYGFSLDPILLTEVLDGAIVALVKVDVGAQHREHSPPQVGHRQTFLGGRDIMDTILKTPEGLPYCATESSIPLNPSRSESIGLALVRSIDVQNSRLLLVTPIPPERLVTEQNERIVLVRGAFDPPEWAYLESLHLNDETNGRGGEVDVEGRPWVTPKEIVGVEGAVWRLRHPPMASTVAKQ